MTIAIIGAGIAGAACAQRLQQQGQHVVVFDKGRAVGGRMSSKRTSAGYLDLGAQYFTARTPAFSSQCQRWLAQQVIERWHGALGLIEQGMLGASPDATERYIGIPSMQKPVQQLLADISVQHAEVSAVHFEQGCWQLYAGADLLGQFQQLVLAVPQQQAARLLQQVIESQWQLKSLFAQIALLPCWAVNIELAESDSLPVQFDGIFVKQDAQISWLARQGSKTGRAGPQHWLVHFTPAWSAEHLELSADEVAQHALAALQRVFNTRVKAVATLSHRWRYAQQVADYPLLGALRLHDVKLGLCGDWLNGGRVENAWLSGKQLAEELAL
ncbi:NAD(P)/FAD-dependent oxidoreductase [Rheinheimera nanhaiensis]|uniref:Amine oxidase domain-containing protein n=1 Tax=Rheinheimera nanhaiensis E407-8 TaxID=562729 RepID=I1E2H1_9GAMM|nr:FAD-dependent oxidoreductase [Rheinheimera nanhaiensis]GAB60499.1 hypothetical protein RNAN_3524 [Rheinheimera nanhaiensis E407-8]